MKKSNRDPHKHKVYSQFLSAEKERNRLKHQVVVKGGEIYIIDLDKDGNPIEDNNGGTKYGNDY